MKTRQQRQYEASLRRGRALMHPADPIGEGLWSVPCERDDCGEVFVTASKQQKYCSENCRRITEYRARRVEHRVAELLGTQCSAPGCEVQFVNSTGRKRYCSDRCRKRAHRDVLRLDRPACEWCGVEFGERRSTRARFCTSRCRLQAHRAGRKEAD